MDDTKPITIFDPVATWKKKTITNFRAEPILTQIFDEGKCVYDLPALDDIRQYCKEQVDTLWEEVKRFEFPHHYYVDLSDRLWKERNDLLEKISVK